MAEASSTSTIHLMESIGLVDLGATPSRNWSSIVESVQWLAKPRTPISRIPFFERCSLHPEKFDLPSDTTLLAPLRSHAAPCSEVHGVVTVVGRVGSVLKDEWVC